MCATSVSYPKTSVINMKSCQYSTAQNAVEFKERMNICCTQWSPKSFSALLQRVTSLFPKHLWTSVRGRRCLIPFTELNSRLRVEGVNKYKWKWFSSVMCCTASWTTGLGLSVSFPLYWPITAARASAAKLPNDSCSVFSETPSWHFSNCRCETTAWVQNSNSVSITAEKTMWATRVPWWTQGCLRIWQQIMFTSQVSCSTQLSFSDRAALLDKSWASP